MIRNFNIYFFLTLLLAVTVLSLIVITPFLEPIFFAVLLATVFSKPYEWVLARVSSPAVASSLMLVVVAVTIVVPVLAVVTLVFNEVAHVVTENTQDSGAIQQKAASFVAYLSAMPLLREALSLIEVQLSPDAIATQMKTVLSNVWPYIQAAYSGVVQGTIDFAVMFFTLFFLFIDGKRWLKHLMHLSPMRDVYERQLIKEFSSMARATLKGTLIIGVVQGVLGGIAFAIAGIFSPVLWMVVMIVLSIIPAVGSGLVIFPAALIMLITGNIWQAVFLACAGTVISLVDNFLRPKLVGKDTQMPTLLVFFSTLGGLSVFGFVGFVVGPIIMALTIALWKIYDREFREQLLELNA